MIPESVRSSRFFRGASGVFIVNVLGLALAFVANIILARTLGVTAYGYYVFALTAVSILSLLALFGLNTSLVRLIATYRTSEQWALLKGVARFSAVLVGLAAIVLMVLIALGTRLAGDGLSVEARSAATAMALLLPVYTFLRLATAALRALGKATLGQIAEVNIRHGLLILIIGVGVARGYGGWDAAAMLSVNTMATLATLAVATAWLWRSWPAVSAEIRPEYDYSHWFSLSLSLLFIAGTQSLLRETDILMLGTMHGPDAAGYYGAAGRLATLVNFGLLSANAIAAPMIAELHFQKKTAQLAVLLRSAAAWSTTIAIVIAVPMIAAAALALSFFGPEFVAGQSALRILVLGNVGGAMAGSAGFLMTMTGHHREAARVFFAALVLNVILNLILIPSFGAAGAATATAISKVAWNVALTIYSIAFLRLNPTFFGKRPL